jgi:hypothetical protein
MPMFCLKEGKSHILHENIQWNGNFISRHDQHERIFYHPTHHLIVHYELYDKAIMIDVAAEDFFL